MSIVNLLRQSATIYPKSGYNKFGRDQSGAGVAVSCRFQNQTKTKILPNQQVVQLVGIFYFTGDTSINTEDRILFGTSNYKVFSVNGFVDGRGTQRMIKCEVTAWQT